MSDGGVYWIGLGANLGDRMAGVEVVGTELAVNLERLAMLEPDLILGSKKRHEEIYPQLTAIAPTQLSGWRSAGGSHPKAPIASR